MNKKDYFVDADIRVAEALPSTAFYDPAFLELERKMLFETAWQLSPVYGDAMGDGATPLCELIAKPLTVAPFTLGDTPLFLSRDKAGTLHAFPNTCTHAWYPLVHESRQLTSDRIMCGQHGRQFSSDGRFQKHAKFTGAHDFPRACDHLKELPVVSWWKFVFTALAKPEVPLGACVGDMEQSISRLIERKWTHVRQQSEMSVIEENWKFHAWNYMDKFHISYIHGSRGGLTDAVNLPTYRTELYDRSALQWVYARDPNDGFEPADLPQRFVCPTDKAKRVYALWWFVFPNMTFNFYPWGLSINVYDPMLGAPEKTRFLWYHLVMDNAKYARRETSWQNQTVNDEDVSAISAVTKSVRSPFAPRGRFAPSVEQGPHWFHRSVYQSIFEKRTVER